MCTTGDTQGPAPPSLRPEACLWQRLPPLGVSAAPAPGELMALAREAPGPLSSRTQTPRTHLERCVWGSLQGLAGERLGVWPTQRPRGTYSRGRGLPRCPPAGLALQSLVACLVDAGQGDTISCLLLLSPAESSVQVCGPLLGSRHQGGGTGKFVCLRPRQSNTPAGGLPCTVTCM